jgi:hypothetical protein
MASIHDEVTTMPNLTFWQWELIMNALTEYGADLFVKYHDSKDLDEKDVIRDMSDECKQIEKIISPVIIELRHEALWS